MVLACRFLKAPVQRIFYLRGEFLSALETTTRQNVAAVLGLHALAETVFLLTLPFFGLIGLKHSLHLFP